MISSNPPHERENLSALFDGELHGDAARFVHKRLAQDVRWRQACGTWQLAGDVLRGHATAAAPADFADRVRSALAQESAVAMRSTFRSRPAWLGGAALAASVALAAWFVASPLDEAAPATMPAATLASSATAPRVAPQEGVSSAAIVAAETAAQDLSRPRRQGESPAVPSAPTPVVVAAAPALASGQPSASASAATADLGSIAPAALADPFQLPPPPTTRPWPRAVLPNFPVTGALTAGYGVAPQNPSVVASGAPGFYPFEPRLPPDVDAAAPSDAP